MELLMFCWRGVLFLLLLIALSVIVTRKVWVLWERPLLFILPVCLLAAILLNGLIIAFEINGTTYSAPSRSPDGSLLMRVVVFRGSALDSAQAKVIVRHPGWPNWHTAYEGSWFGDERGGVTPYVTWDGSHQLRIKVPSDYYGQDECKSALYDVKTDCEPQKETK